MSIVAQRKLGNKTITKTFSTMAWSLLGNDKGGWTLVNQDVANEMKVLEQPPTGNKVEFTTEATSTSKPGEQKVGNEAEQNTGSEAATSKDNLSEKASSANGTQEEMNAGQKLTDDRSVNYGKSSDAIKALNTFNSIDDVKAFITGEDRAKVLNAAAKIIGE